MHVPPREARELFLKAQAIRSQGSLEAFHSGVTDLTRAIEIDPSYSDAYAALAGLYASAAGNFGPEPLSYIPPAKAAAAKALELDPWSYRAFAVQGYMDGLILMDWSRAESELRKAVLLQPKDSGNHNWLGLTLLAQGRFEKAIQELRTAQDLDPLHPGATLGFALYCARRYDEALHELIQMIHLHPDVIALHPYLGAVYEAKGEYEKPEAEYDFVLPTQPYAVKDRIAHLLAVMGKRDQAQRLLAELEHPREQPPDAFSIAIIHAALDERDQAFEWLERAYDSRKIALVKVHPMLDPLRADERYQAFLKKARLDP